MKGRTFLKNFTGVFVSTVFLFAIVESLLRAAYFIRNSMVTAIPLPYVIGNDYGPVPPWLDGLRILQPDDTLIWKNRPNLKRQYMDIFSPAWSEEERRALLRRFFPTLPTWTRQKPSWEISLNGDGFRDRDFPKIKPPASFRIICLGDSWTFGANVGQEETYPQRLRALLRQKFPGADFEVFNLGVLGYSSYQGLELLKRKIIDLAPDLVVIAFAMNDSNIAGWRDKDMAKQPITLLKRISRVLEKIESYNSLRYLALVLKYKPNSIGHPVKAVADSASRPEEAVDYEKLEPWVRVSPADYKKNILEMINLARSHKVDVIVLYNQLSADAGEVAGIGPLGLTSPYRMALEEISRTERVPLVDSSVLVAKARRRIAEELELKLDLQVNHARRTQAKGEIEVIFRVYTGEWPVAKAVYLTGTHPKLGNLVPNKIAMYDDGTHGDQKAGDKVWSYASTFPRGTAVSYVYTNSGKEGRWEGLDVPHIRSFRVEARNNEGKLYRPIESFGKIYMQADSWHTNAAGYELIAKALLEALKKNDKVKTYLRNRGAATVESKKTRASKGGEAS